MNDKLIINQFAEKIVNRGLSVPAIFLLGSTKYISFVGHVEVVLHRSFWTTVMLIFTTFFFSKWFFCELFFIFYNVFAF